MEVDIIIIGGGPAGICAAIYASRANKKVLVLEREVIGGKIVTSPLIENYPGIERIKGPELSENLQEQLNSLGGEIRTEEVLEIKDEGKNKKVMTKRNMYTAQAIIIATGTRYKKLGLEKEEKFIGGGISFCAVCDGFFFKDKQVAVIGGGNTAIANALELANICKKVYIIQLANKLTAEPILIKQLEGKNNIEILYDTSVTKYLGDEKIAGIEIKKANKKQELKVEGIFIGIGQIPETTIVQDIIVTNNEGYIKVNEDFMTSKDGIFAAGDCIEKKVRQLTTAVNDGTIAALNAIEYIQKA